jgi:phage terminase small subunit
MSPESLQGVAPAKKRKLSLRKLLFIEEYLKDFNASKAAERCGLSAKTAYSAGPRMLEDVEVRNEIKRRLKISEIPSLAELSRLTYSDARNLFREDGTLKSPKEWDDQTASSVASIEVEEVFTGQGKNRVWTGYLKKVKLWNKSQNLENMLKHLHLINERDEAQGNQGRGDLSGASDGDLQRKLVLIICRITGQPVPQEIQIEGHPVDSPSGLITDGDTRQNADPGGGAQDLIDEILQKQKKEKGDGGE